MQILKLRFLYSVLFAIGVLNSGLIAQDFTQHSSTSGLSAGLELGYFAWKAEDLDFTDYVDGLGLRAQVRYGINELVSFGINFLTSFNMRDYSGGESFSVNAFQFGGRVNLLETNSTWRPFLGASLSYSTANPELVIIDTGVQGISSIKGFGVGLEGGVNYFINTRTSVDFSVNLVTGTYKNNLVAGQEISEEIGFSTLFFGLGFNYQLVY